MRTQNTTVLTVEQDQTDQELVFKPQNPTVAGRMSMKGTLPKAGEERTNNLRDEPFLAGEETKQAAANGTNANQAAQGNEERKGDAAATTASKEPILGLESNNNANQNKVPLKTIDQLLIHNSDTAVKPIIGNKDIERHGTLEYTPSSLPFEPWTAE